MVASCSSSVNPSIDENISAAMSSKSEQCYVEKTQPTPRFSGFVKFFNTQKGYGFIIPTEDLSLYYKIVPSESRDSWFYSS